MNDKTQTFKGQLGGRRPGAGRPKGSTSSISSRALLRQIETMNNGTTYEELLVDDFMAARRSGDNNLILKYHSMILSKVMSTLSRVEMDDLSNSIEAKQIAFSAALSAFIAKDE